jgi:hypothetical protein
MTLDGLEKVVQDKYHRNSKSNIENHYRAKTKVNLVRYADDFIITANSKETAEELKGVVSKFLESRGLRLSEEKTIITHINDGFDFLGWTFRKFKGKLIVKPSKSSIKSLIRKCSTIILKEGKANTLWQVKHSLMSTIHFTTYCIYGLNIAILSLVEFVSKSYLEATPAAHFIHSYSSKGNPWDNACIESFHALIKREWLNRYVTKNARHLMN